MRPFQIGFFLLVTSIYSSFAHSSLALGNTPLSTLTTVYHLKDPWAASCFPSLRPLFFKSSGLLCIWGAEWGPRTLTARP